MSDAPDFETALKRLEEIVKKLENGDLSLDSALESFVEGIKHSRFFHNKKEQAARPVEILLKNK
jgi:exodeoxyribonuclease VII small subunit